MPSYRGRKLPAPISDKLADGATIGQGALMDLPAVSAAACGKRELVKPRGHAALPGSGPDGETCGSCRHYVIVDAGRASRFRKCALTRDRWSKAPTTDIRKKDPACSKWQEQEKQDGKKNNANSQA